MAAGADVGAVGGLEVAEFGLVVGVEFFEGCVFFAGGAGEEDVGFFSLGLGVEELELGVGDAAELFVGGGGFGAVGIACELEESVAGVDFLAGDLAEVSGLDAEDVLLDDFVAEEFEDVLDFGAGGFEFAGDGGDEDAWLHVFFPGGWGRGIRKCGGGEGVCVKVW